MGCNTVAGAKINETAAQSIAQVASQDAAGESITYTADTVNLTGQILTDTFSSNTHREGMFSSSTQSLTQQTPVFMPAVSQAPAVIIQARTASVSGGIIQADELHDKTAQGLALTPVVKEMRYRQQVTSSSPLSSSDCGVEGGQEVMLPTQILVNRIIRTLEQGEMILQSVNWDRDKTHIIGKFKETVYDPQSWQQSWAHVHQVIPDEVLVVVALAITIATQGAGAPLVNGVSSAIFGTTTLAATATTLAATVPTIGLTATGIAMANAGFTALCVQAGTSFLRHGDITQTARDVFSRNGLRAVATAVATAGLIGDGGGSIAHLGIGQQIIVNGIRSFVRAGVSSAIEGRRFNLRDIGVSTLADTASNALAQQIGRSAPNLTWLEHKLAHFGAAAGVSAVVHSHDRLASALTSGAGAVLGEIMAESMVDRRQIEIDVLREMGQDTEPFTIEGYQRRYRQKLKPIIDMSRLAVGGMAAACGQDPNLAICAATNALENNFNQTIPMPRLGWLSLIKIGGMESATLYSASHLATLQAQLGLDGTFQKLVEEGSVRVHSDKQGKLFFSVRDELFATAAQAWNAVVGDFTPTQQEVFKQRERERGTTLEATLANPVFLKAVQSSAIDAAPHDILGNHYNKKADSSKKKNSDTKLNKGKDANITPPEKADVPDYKTSGFQKKDKIDIKRFKYKDRKGDLIDQKTGEKLSLDKAHNSGSPHGGSYYKLKDRFGNRIGTFSKDGRFLR